MKRAAVVTGSSEVEYRPVVGFPGYRVGSDGSFWSCLKQVAVKGDRRGRWVTVIGDQWRELSKFRRASGHVAVSMSVDGKLYNRLLHRLVLEAFVGPRPAGMQGCHNNGNPGDNRISNLRWDTPKGNAADKRRHGTELRGEGIANAKLSDAAVADIRRTYVHGKRGCGLRLLAKRYGVSVTTVAKVVQGTQWRHVEAK